MRVVFVHGACVRDGGWWWHRTAAVLERDGIASEAPPLPTCGEGGVPGVAGYDDDVASVRAVLTASAEPTVVVAHSYGGIVTAEAADGLAGVTSLLLVSSYLPEVGQSLAAFAGDEPAPFLSVDPDAGTFAVRPDAFVDTFMHDCPDDVVAESVDHLAAQSVSVTQQPVRAAAWQHIPSVYLVCGNDRGTPAARQREFAERATRTVELDTGHHPFLSEPEAVARIVRDLA